MVEHTVANGVTEVRFLVDACIFLCCYSAIVQLVSTLNPSLNKISILPQFQQIFPRFDIIIYIIKLKVIYFIFNLNIDSTRFFFHFKF